MSERLSQGALDALAQLPLDALAGQLCRIVPAQLGDFTRTFGTARDKLSGGPAACAAIVSVALAAMADGVPPVDALQTIVTALRLRGTTAESDQPLPQRLRALRWPDIALELTDVHFNTEGVHGRKDDRHDNND